MLPHEENHGITLRRLKQVPIPITQMQGTQTPGWLFTVASADAPKVIHIN